MPANLIAEGDDLVGKALTVVQGIAERDVALATRFMDPAAFRQHNLQCADGVAGFGEFIGGLPPTGGAVETVRVFRDGPFVVTHSVGDLFGPKAFFDIYRFEDGLIVEHWDNLAELAPPNRSGRTMVDGSSGTRDAGQTDRNKDIVGAFFEDAFVRGGLETADGYFDGDALIQHNAPGEDGLGALKAMMRARHDAGEQLTDASVRHVLGEGELVLVTADGLVGGRPMAFYDLFRVQDGMIAEHWDVVQAIPPESEWRNPNGKF